MEAGDDCEELGCEGWYEWERDEDFRQHVILTCNECGSTTGRLDPM
jgi:hypothetical protein